MLLCAQYVIPVTAGPIENGAVLVSDGKIKDIGAADMMKLRYPEESISDFGKAALTPGFIDLYSCSEDAVLRGLIPDVPYTGWLRKVWELRSKLTKDEVYNSAFLGVLESISSGITTMADITKTGGCVKAAQEIGIRGVFYHEVNAVEKKLINYAIKKATEDLKKWDSEIDSERIKLGLAPAQVFRCHPQLYRAITDYANEHGNIPIALRLAGSTEEYRFVKVGATLGEGDTDERVDIEGYMEFPPWLPTSVTPVNYVLNWGALNAKNVLAIHCAKVDDSDVETLKSHDIAIAVCPTINAQLGMGAAPISEFIRSGMRVGISTNAPAALDFVDIFTEMRVALLIQRAMNAGSHDFLSSQTLMEMGTIRAAEALHIDDKVGSLEIGKEADIVAIDLSGSHQIPTNDPVTAVLSSSTASDVMMTMVGGNILYDSGRWNIDADVSKNLQRILEIRARLRAAQTK